MEPLGTLWTSVLDLLTQVVTPVWNDLIQYIPLALFGLVLLSVLLVAWSWQRNSARNRPPRVVRVPSGRMPADVHLPGPSPWPFVAPIGLAFMVFSVAMGFDSLADLLLFGLGAVIGVVGIVGWLGDANREYGRVEAGAHGSAAGHLEAGGVAGSLGAGGVAGSLEAGGAEATVRQPPADVHLPGPSAWPFLAPIGLVIAVLGLVFGPALIVGGLVMGAIATVGWLLDAGREYQGVEAHGHADARTMDPEKAFPKALGPVYVAVAGVALFFTLIGPVLSLLPGTSSGGPVGPQPTDTPHLSASQATAFDQTELAVFAGRDFSLTFDNKQEGVPHNVAIWDTPAMTTNFFQGEIFPGVATRVYNVARLAAGVYYFACSVHPPMHGTLYVK